MNKRFIFFISCLLVVMMVATSCTAYANNYMCGIKPGIKDRVPEPMDNNINTAILNFSWNLFSESIKNPGNIMISPASAYFALGMTINGANGETKAAMMEALSAKEISEEDLNIGLMYWMNNLMSSKRIAKLSVANSIWLRNEFKADNAFLQKNADYFRASVQGLDFRSKTAKDTINQWVKNATNGTIDKIVENIQEDTIMYLINAIYFKGDWKEQFSAYSTRPMMFNMPEGAVKTDFMSRTGSIKYIKGNDAECVILPYLDEQFAFIGLLPKEGQTPRDLAKKLKAQDLKDIMDSSEETAITLYLPKFKSSYADSLKDELSKLGMEIAFDSSRSDFSLMEKNRDSYIYLNDVMQKTYIKVDEKGTEAAAVTSVVLQNCAIMENVRVAFDRSFIYSIMDVTTGIPIFIGIMENPSAEK